MTEEAQPDPEQRHPDNSSENLGTSYPDPYGSCLSEGSMRHCVNSCILQSYTNIGAVTQFIAQCHGNDLPWSEHRDEGDIAANQAGIDIMDEQGIENSCIDSCGEWFDQAHADQCCPDQPLLGKDDPDCGCSSESE